MENDDTRRPATFREIAERGAAAESTGARAEEWRNATLEERARVGVELANLADRMARERGVRKRTPLDRSLKGIMDSRE